MLPDSQLLEQLTEELGAHFRSQLVRQVRLLRGKKVSTLETARLEEQLSNLLSSYLLGRKTLRDCAEWLSGIDWEQVGTDSPLAASLGELDLLCTEASEGLRAESDLERKASEVVADISCRVSPSRMCMWYSAPHSDGTVAGSSTDVMRTTESPAPLFSNI
jgi:hypothetical protein